MNLSSCENNWKPTRVQEILTLDFRCVRHFLEALLEWFLGPTYSHSKPRIDCRILADSASSAAISSTISLGLRCLTSPLTLGFLTERSKVSWLMDLASMDQDLGESAKVFWSWTNSFRSSSLRGLVLPRLRPGSSW